MNELLSTSGALGSLASTLNRGKIIQAGSYYLRNRENEMYAPLSGFKEKDKIMDIIKKSIDKVSPESKLAYSKMSSSQLDDKLGNWADGIITYLNKNNIN